MNTQQMIVALPFEFVRKMRNWAKSSLDGGGISLASPSMFAGVGDGSGYESHDPIINGEAIDVDACLVMLPNRYRQAVMLFWQYEGRPFRWFGRRLHVEHRTAQKRIEFGHTLLREKLAIRAAHANHYREAARAAFETAKL